MMAILARRANALERPGGDPADLVAFLRAELLPHAKGEEAYLYPAVEPLLRQESMATATMSIDHEHIVGYVDRLAAASERLAVADVDEREARLIEVRILAAQLEALLRVHLEKEERVYLPLLERHLSASRQAEIVEGMHALDGALQ